MAFCYFCSCTWATGIVVLGSLANETTSLEGSPIESISDNLSSEPAILPAELKKSEHNYKMVEVEGSLEPRSILFLPQ